MLDEDEYNRILSKRDASNADARQEFAPVLAEYERITDFRETNINAVFHHRLSLYGPPCRFCGKPLRTPEAKFCGACMKPVA